MGVFSRFVVRCMVPSPECGRSTFFPRNRDPRKRWLLGIVLMNDDADGNEIIPGKGKEIVGNLCPNCARDIFHLTEHDYAQLESIEMALPERVLGRKTN